MGAMTWNVEPWANPFAPAPAHIAAARASVTDVPGVPGFAVYGGYLADREKSADMRGSAKWTRYREMIRNTAIVGAGVRRYLTLTGSPAWTIPPYLERKADAPDPDDVMMAEWAEDQLAHTITPWPTVVMSAAMSRWYGSTIQVWAARRLPDGMVGLADVVDRPMHTIERWNTEPDGTVTGVVQRDPTTGAEHEIPRSRMVWSRDIPLTDSPDGVGILRQLAEAVRQLEALFRMLHQGLETDLSGIPIVYAPVEEMLEKVKANTLTRADFDRAVARLISFATNHVRTKETGLVFDSGPQIVQGQATSSPRYRIELLQAGGQSFGSILDAIKQKLWEIAIVTGFEYLLLGADGSGSLAMAQIKTADAYRLVASFLNSFAVTVQRDILRPLWALNGRDPMRAPLPVWDRLEFADVAAAAGSVLNPLSAAGVTIDRTDAIVNEVITRAGFSPLEEREDDAALGPIDEATARRFGVGAPDAEDNPEAVVDPADAEDVGDDPTADDEMPAPAKKARRRR